MTSSNSLPDAQSPDNIEEMKIMRFALTAVLWIGLLEAPWAAADTHYVALGGQTPVPDYTNWASAATNIQVAVDVSTAGDTVLVSNGVYATGTTNVSGTNRVHIGKAITVRSVNGPDVTIVKGTWASAGTTNGTDAVRCVSMNVANSSLIGFTLTNGATTTDGLGGGVNGILSSFISNCVLAGNAASSGGGAYNCTLFNCTIVGNFVSATTVGGGGALSCILSNCTIVGNSASGSSEGGGAHGCTMYNCTITSNSALWKGGGAYNSTLYNCTLIGNWTIGIGDYGGGGAHGGTLYNCTLTRNSAGKNGGGARSSTLYNCLLVGNQATYGGGASYGTLYNCTVVGNKATTGGGGVGRLEGVTLVNCIVYSNSPDNWYDTTSIFTNSCTAPTQTTWVAGDGNITNYPMFIASGSGYGTNHVAGNYRLTVGSPCVNTGTNFSWMTDSTNVHSKDLDGNRRLDRFGGRPDMGCYEYVPPGTIYRFH